MKDVSFLMSSIAMYLLGLDNVYEFRKKQYSRRRSFRILWYFIEFISILPLSRGQIVIAEWFVIDRVVALAFATSNELLINGNFAKTIFNFILKASLLIYIGADYDAILSRGRVDESIDFIHFQRKFYSELARKLM
jgi:hypothetical protein